MLSFTIDNREHKLIEELRSRQDTIPFETSPLDIGDIVINDLIFERKTWSDLKASVQDGRYREQKKRAIANGIAITYIIEGSHLGYLDQDKTMTGCIINTLVRDRIPIVFTTCLKETADFITCLSRRIEADPQKYALGTDSSSNSSYVASICLKKKENVNPIMCFTLQLACIPGISSKKATDLLHAHPDVQNMKDLVSKLQTTPLKDFCKATPGIGKTLATTLYNYLLGTTATSTTIPALHN